MQDVSLQFLTERVAQCEDLAKHARDPSIRAKAAELAQGYRKLILSADCHSRPGDLANASLRKVPSLWASEHKPG